MGKQWKTGQYTIERQSGKRHGLRRGLKYTQTRTLMRHRWKELRQGKSMQNARNRLTRKGGETDMSKLNRKQVTNPDKEQVCYLKSNKSKNL